MLDHKSYARVLVYPTGIVRFQFATTPLFRLPGWERRTPSNYIPPATRVVSAVDPEESARASVSRARSCVRDLCLCNSFTYFFTWTIDPKLHDSLDVQLCLDYLVSYLRNITFRYGFSYVLVVERQKNGGIHFHGLCELGSMEIVRAINPHTGLPLSDRSGRPVYNMPGWTWGFSTCVPVDSSYYRTVNYLLKYITKDFTKIFPRRYYSSRNLVRSPDVMLFNPSESFEEWVVLNNARVYRAGPFCIAESSVESPDYFPSNYVLKNCLESDCMFLYRFNRLGSPVLSSPGLMPIYSSPKVDCFYADDFMFNDDDVARIFPTGTVCSSSELIAPEDIISIYDYMKGF